MFDTWETTLRIKFNADEITAEEVLNLVMNSGNDIGIEGKKIGRGGSHGAFKVCAKPAPSVSYLKYRKHSTTGKGKG
jgi:hypothetical protein